MKTLRGAYRTVRTALVVRTVRLALVALAAWAAAQTARAQFLKQGDTVAVVSPCSAVDSATVARGIRTLERWGYHCVTGRNVLNEHHGFAGTIGERRDDLMWALREPTVRAVVCTRGGDGAAHLLVGLPLDSLRRYPKLVVGFSDVTALLCAEARAGNMAVHGSMCHALGAHEGADTVSRALQRMLSGDLPEYRVAPHPLDVVGSATGVLVGGNLSVYNDLAGSDYDPLLMDGIILFMEDTGESMTRVDRMLHNMEVRGLTGRLRAVIVGQFSDYKHPENGFDDMYHMLHEYLRHYGVPVCYGFPTGHARLRNFPLLVGARATIDVTPQGTTLRFERN